jgi:very-short-patch-repair endonuclease
MSKGEEAFYEAWEIWSANTTPQLPLPEREYRFHPTRMWRFDFCWPQIKLAVEIEGRGRHQTFAGFREDTCKYNEAVRLGWRVLRFCAADYRKAAEWVEYVRDVMCTSPEV